MGKVANLFLGSDSKLLDIEVALIPTKLRIYPYDTPTHSRVGQLLVI